MPNNCPLCNKKGNIFYQQKNRLFHKCDNCASVFLDKNLRPNSVDEKIRYETHNNDVYDLGYQKFVSPITKSIMNKYSITDKGLDFGSGTGPVISKVLTDRNFSVTKYDPYFENNPSVLKEKYAYIACCEVIEHFYNPQKEFGLLKNLLQPNGSLYCMTDLYDFNTDFHTWYYKNDPTHVFLYTQKTMEWIRKEYGFKKVTIKHRLITFFT